MIKWTKEDDDKLKELCLVHGYSAAQMMKFFPNRTKQAIIGRRGFLKLKSKYKRPKKYTFNENYFSEYNNENCYWAGILLTDGHIGIKDRYKHIKWGCAMKDIEHMENFKKMINSTHPIKKINKPCNISTLDDKKLHAYCYMDFWSVEKWADDLKNNFGFDHNKTLRTEMPKMTSILHKLSFIKGVIDGDGCISIAEKQAGISISICGCNKELLLWIKDVFDSLNLPTLAHRASEVRGREGENCYYWSRAGFTAAVIFELLNRLECPFLTRKWRNPDILKIIDYWESRKEIWPHESFFTSILQS